MLRRSGFSSLNIALIPADGIGREVIPAARRVLEAALPSTLPLTFPHLNAGFDHFQKTGIALPPATIETLKDPSIHGALFGAVSSPSHRVEGYKSPIVELRRVLDLYANVRPVVGVDAGEGRERIDLVVVRENTECLYIKSERMETLEDGTKVAWAQRKISETASRKIARSAIAIARQRKGLNAARGRDQSLLTVVHKSNVLSVTDGLFRESCLRVYEEGGEVVRRDVKLEEQLVDSMVYRLFREPLRYDVIVAPNFHGDIVSDAAAALVGSLGLVASANMGETFCMGEPVHGSAPDIEGKGIANPIAAIRSGALLLSHLGFESEAAKIHTAVDSVLRDADMSVLTPDLGGRGTTDGITDLVIRRL